MGLHIIRDTDVVTRELDGDKLVLLSAPRQRDVEVCDEIATKEAFASMAAMRESGMDVDAMMKDAEKKKKPDDKPDPVSAKVREARLKALAVALFVDGEKLGGDAIAVACRDMDPASAAWVDEQVASVWDSALPSEVDTRG